MYAEVYVVRLVHPGFIVSDIVVYCAMAKRFVDVVIVDVTILTLHPPRCDDWCGMECLTVVQVALSLDDVSSAGNAWQLWLSTVQERHPAAPVVAVAVSGHPASSVEVRSMGLSHSRCMHAGDDISMTNTCKQSRLR